MALAALVPCEPACAEVCKTVTRAKTWADGPNLASFAGPNTAEQCFARCAAYEGDGGEKCDLSIRDPATGDCFLKASSPLMRSLDLETTFCEPSTRHMRKDRIAPLPDTGTRYLSVHTNAIM